MDHLNIVNELINPVVMGDLVNETLEENMQFSALCKIEDTLFGRSGDTIVVPKYAYIGDATEVEANTAIPLVDFAAENESITIKKAGNGVTLSDESLLSGYGDPVGEAVKQLSRSIAQKVDGDAFAALEEISEAMTVTLTTTLSADGVADALVKFGETQGEKILFVSPEQMAAIRKTEERIKESDNFEKLSLLHGCRVAVSERIVKDAEDGTYTDFIVMPGALALYLAKDTLVEADRDIVKKSTIITADKHYAIHLADESKAVKLVCKA